MGVETEKPGLEPGVPIQIAGDASGKLTTEPKTYPKSKVFRRAIFMTQLEI